MSISIPKLIFQVIAVTPTGSIEDLEDLVTLKNIESTEMDRRLFLIENLGTLEKGVVDGYKNYHDFDKYFNSRMSEINRCYYVCYY